MIEMEIDPVSGLPKELGILEDISKENQVVVVMTEKRRFGKVYTIVKGLDNKSIDIQSLVKDMKKKFACGGTSKSNMIELQGNHKSKMKDFLISKGFAEESILIQ